MRATLAGNIQPSPEVLARSLDLGRRIASVQENRVKVIQENGLDAQFGLPGGPHWRQVTNPDSEFGFFRHCLEHPEMLQHLRFRSQNFTGFSLNKMYRGPGTSHIDPVPDDWDSLMLKEENSPYEASWRGSISGIPEEYVYRPPHMCGEVGWLVDGGVLNPDTIDYQQTLNMIYASGVFKTDKRLRVLEIGGGYGAIASAVRRIAPTCEYWICDLPESLFFSGLYLSLTGHDVTLHGLDGLEDPAEGFVLVPNYLFQKLTRPFDVAINTLSLAEMDPYQIDTYLNGVRTLLGSDGCFFEQNYDNGVSMKARVSNVFKQRTPLGSSQHGEADLWRNS